MLNSFEVSHYINEDYTYSYQFEDNLVINYLHENIFNIEKSNDVTVACYGYCFDVRGPKSTTSATLKDLAGQGTLEEDMKYLNGHFILLYNISGEWKLITDAVSITPLYIDFEKEKVFPSLEEQKAMAFNSNMELNLKDFTLSRIEQPSNKLTDERIERIILDAVQYQYKYFEDKSLTVNFRRNRMNKALISILYQSLQGKYINLRENDDLTLRVGQWMARDYNMRILEEDVEPSTDFICNVHLMDYKVYQNTDREIEEEEINQFFENNLLGMEERTKDHMIEYNLQNHLKYRQEDKGQLIFDPFNVRTIQDWIYKYSDNKIFNPLNRIVKIMNPTIDFYDFSKGVTLLQKYDQLLAKNKKLKEETKKSFENFEFIQEARDEGIKLSSNLDGRFESDGITVYPASIEISKGDVFEIEYTKKGQGLILVETFFDNPKNAHRIKVEVNEEIVNIDEFLNGKFLNIDSVLSMKMYYERDYSAASWQKAGKIRIKEID